MTQLKHTLCLGLLSVTLGLAAEPARAADQTVPGTGNATAIALSSKAPMVQSAKEFLLERIKKIDNATTRAITQDAIANPTTCVAHRVGLTEGQKDAILQELVAAGLVDTRDDATFPNGLKAGVFRVCVATRLDAAPILAGEEERGMANFLEYNPEQAYLLPPTVREVLGEGHLCFFVHGAVEKLDLQEFEAGYSDEGHPAYHPALLLKVWLYAYALGMTSSRRLEQRIREDLAFRYLAGGAQPDFWALNEFRKRHGRAMNDIFTQVVELARSLGLGKLGHVAIDSTRIAANAATSCTDSLEKL